MEFANGLYARGMYGPAVSEYKSFLSDFPKSELRDAARFRLGESLRRTGETSSARKELVKVFEEYPKSPFARKAGLILGKMRSESGEHAEAAEIYRTLLGRKPPGETAGAALYLLGMSLVRTGKMSEAVESLEILRKKYKSSEFHIYGLLQLGRIYASPEFEARMGDRALELFRETADKSSDRRASAEAVFQIAALHFGRGAFEKSYAAYRELFKKYPKDKRSASSRLQAAWAAHNAGLYAEALNKVERVLKKDEGGGNTPEWLYLKANCLRRLVKNSEAVAVYEFLLKKYPDHRLADAASYEKAVVCYQSGRFKEVVKSVGKESLGKGNTRDKYWLLAESLAALGKSSEAVQYYRLIVRKFPGSDIAPDAMYRLAHLLQEAEQYKEASRQYNDLVRTFPKNDLAPRALFASGFCLAKAGNHAEAIRDWSALTKDYSSSDLAEQAYYHKAMGEIRLGRNGQAKNTISGLLEKFPKTQYAAEAYYWQGALLVRAGQYKDAEQKLRTALRNKPDTNTARETRFQLGVALQKLRRADEAAEIFQPLLSSSLKKEFSPGLLEWLASHNFKNKKFRKSAEAAEMLAKNAKKTDRRQKGWYLVGRSALAGGDESAAEKAFKKSLKEGGNRRIKAESALRLGRIELKKKKYGDAGKHFSEASRLAEIGRAHV